MRLSPAVPGQRPPLSAPPAPQGDEAAFLLDFSGGPGFARRLAGACARVVVLDHHKTAAAELGDPALGGVEGLEVTFDMERSGATIRCGVYVTDFAGFRVASGSKHTWLMHAKGFCR